MAIELSVDQRKATEFRILTGAELRRLVYLFKEHESKRRLSIQESLDFEVKHICVGYGVYIFYIEELSVKLWIKKL